jgi:glycosyltransferase involved in cell wall biosynthesis
MTQPDELAIYLPSGQVAPPANPYGRLVANAGVYRALARYGGYSNLHLQCHGKLPLDRLAWELLGEAARDGAPSLSAGSPLATAAPARAGVLLSGQPYLSELAWIRRHAGKDDAYSIAGTIFAFASATHRERMMQSALAPLHEWDALICSSPTLEETVRRTFDVWEDYLRERLGGVRASEPAEAIRLPRPQLPVIPFGVDAETVGAHAADAGARKALRTAHGIADTDVVVYFLGRLSFYDKAFPQAMLKAVEAAQQHTGVKTHFLLTGWFPGGEKDRLRFAEAAHRYAPTVNAVFLDGNDADVVAQCWAAADVFLLLSDTILETFGQALVEAMAAGLPLVVSDWDGYRFIVRDGVDGFLVPTLGAPGGPLGETLSLLQSLDAASYPQYAGSVAQHTAVHVGRAAEALTRLIASPELRASMGAAGKHRATEVFSWPVVTRQYTELFAELAERRLRARAAADTPASAALSGARTDPGAHRMNPLRGDPFVDFRGHPSEVLYDDLRLRLAAGCGRDSLGPDPAVELDQMFPGLRGSPEEAREVVSLLQEAGSLSVREVLLAFPPNRRPFVRMSVMWLAKAGVVDWLPLD